jgi:hypothetical protein
VVRLPFVSMTYETELAEAARRVREEFTAEKLHELLERIHRGAGNADTLRAQAELQYFLTVLQTSTQERATSGLVWATWILACATLALVIATVIGLFVG